MTERSVTFDEFTVRRSFPVPPSTVFRAFSEAESKYAWLGGDPGAPTTIESVWDFRVGGTEINSTHFHGSENRYVATYLDIVPDRRIIYSYELSVAGLRLSASLVTIELSEGIKGGTELVHTEFGAFLDGHETPSVRAAGTEGIYDALLAHLPR